MATRFDFEAYGADAELALVVEVKARRDASSQWAREVREQLFGDLKVSRKAMFMLATLDVIYLWKEGAPLDELATYELKVVDLFAPYFRQAGVDPTKPINPIVLEAIVGAWLDDRTHGRGPTDPLLEKSGLTVILRGGRVVAQAAA